MTRKNKNTYRNEIIITQWSDYYNAHVESSVVTWGEKIKKKQAEDIAKKHNAKLISHKSLIFEY